MGILNLIGLAAITLIVGGIVLAILAVPLARLWYYLQEVQDENNGEDT